MTSEECLLMGVDSSAIKPGPEIIKELQNYIEDKPSDSRILIWQILEKATDICTLKDIVKAAENWRGGMHLHM